MSHSYALGHTKTLHSTEELEEAGLIPKEIVGEINNVSELFSIGVSPEILDKIQNNDAQLGVARQFIPDVRELHILPEESADPIGDTPYMPIKGITHRYPDRLLLIPNHTCAVYCRFCFRREKVGPGEEYLNPDEMKAALDYIRNDKDLREVILTGGDPLVLSPRRIRALVEAFSSMEHIDVIRFHTRIPVVAPHLISDDFLSAITTDKIVCVVVHANHCSEFGEPAREALKRLRHAGVMLVSHSVLLKGINDTPEALTALMREFVRNGVKPYYLHHCDLAEGTSHFRTTFEEGQELMRAIRGRLSGLAQPNYVLHIPGGAGKVPIGPTYLERDEEGWKITDYLGGKHRYPLGATSPNSVTVKEDSCASKKE